MKGEERVRTVPAGQSRSEELEAATSAAAPRRGERGRLCGACGQRQVEQLTAETPV